MTAVKSLGILAFLLMAGTPSRVAADTTEDSTFPSNSSIPTSLPSDQPSSFPSEQPTSFPSNSSSPTSLPSDQPSAFPSEQPTSFPSNSSIPTSLPSDQPSSFPSEQPTSFPSYSSSPTFLPSDQPSAFPSEQPTSFPSYSSSPTLLPSDQPSAFPSEQPTSLPSYSSSPTSLPSDQPSAFPSEQPTSFPSYSSSPTSLPSDQPSATASEHLTMIPSSQPSVSLEPSATMIPSSHPSLSTTQPSLQPSNEPSTSPSLQPSRSNAPSTTFQPSFQPSSSSAPSTTTQPSLQPIVSPTEIPSRSIQPSSTPTASFIASVEPSSLPTIIPTDKLSPGPSYRPTSVTPIPTAYNCDGKTDIDGEFQVDEVNGNKSCKWVDQARKRRCKKMSANLAVKDLCPITCGLCTLPPSPMPFPQPSVIPSGTPTLEPSSTATTMISYKPSLKLSSTPTSMPNSIPSLNPSLKTSSSSSPSLGLSSSPSVSLVPSVGPSVSTVPTNTVPVALLTTVSIEIGPIEGSKMNVKETELFERIAKAWIEPLFESNEPEITLTSLQVVDQKLVRSTGRRLQGSSSSLMVDVKINGEFEPTEDFTGPADIKYEDTVKRHFLTQESRGALLDDLKESDDASGTYFASLTGLGLSSGNQIIDDARDNNGKKSISDNDIIIIAATVSGGAIIMFAAALYIWTKKRRSNSNSTLERIEEDVEADIAAMNRPTPQSMDFKNMGSLFPDIATPKAKVDDIDNWEAMTPQVPEPPQSHRKITKVEEDLYGDDDDATDGGKSQRTFNTLEKIYSNESENASYQSYGYSLEDGIKSKASVSPGTVSMAESGPMKMDLYALNTSRYEFTEDDETLEVSVGSPGTVNSGLTYDDASKVAATKIAARAMMHAKGVDEMQNETFANNFIRVCQAPPGKLGVVIDTTKNGPVVHQVKAGSPLEGIIYAGDRIIAIDDIDTKGMTASNVTKIMAKKCDEPRKITVSSETYQGTF